MNVVRGRASGEVTVDLRDLTSDDRHCDEYLRANLFTDSSQLIVSCSVADINLESGELDLPWALNSRCGIGSFSADQTWLITGVVWGAQPTVLRRRRVLFGSSGNWNIAQEPIAKDARVI